jgi:hypothetical protein
MRRFVCPKCGHTVEAIAVEVGHHCPKDHNRWTAFVHEPNERQA